MKLKTIILVFSLSMLSTSIISKPFRVLSIDGGGVRGIVAAVMLEQLEKETGRPISKLFDMVAGTSTGGFIAMALSAPNGNGDPIKTAKQLVDIYIEKSQDIFHASLLHKIKTLGGLLGPKYESDNFRRALINNLGNTKLSEAIIPTLVTGYHIEGQTGVEFYSENAKNFPQDMDCMMWQVVMATCAAPVYFDSVDVEFPWGNLNAVVDGALYKHNPALLAYINAKNDHPDREIEVYSIGTGRISAEEMSAELKGRGLLSWLSPLLQHLRIGGSEADNTILHKLLNSNGKQNFFRFNVNLDRAHKNMDNTLPSNIEYLYNKGLAMTKTTAFKQILNVLK